MLPGSGGWGIESRALALTLDRPALATFLRKYRAYRTLSTEDKLEASRDAMTGTIASSGACRTRHDKA
jgi:hypothetical protein